MNSETFVIVFFASALFAVIAFAVGDRAVGTVAVVAALLGYALGPFPKPTLGNRRGGGR